MPKRGRGNRQWKPDGGSGRDGGKYYYEHDDRGFSDSTRKVSFKPSNRITKHGRQRDYDIHIRTRLDDDDVDMSASFTGGKVPGRYNPYKGNRNHHHGGRRGRGGGGRVHVSAPSDSYQKVPGASNWYRVTIPYGAKHPKDFILKLLLNFVSPLVFIPIAYKNIVGNSTFYIEDGKVAEKLMHADRKLSAPDGFKLGVKVRPDMPNVTLNEPVKEKMKQAMVKRYNPENRALDLSKFHLDSELVDDCVMPLFRPNIMLAAIDIIADNLPDLLALNLANNKLHNIVCLRVLPKKLPSLTGLHIGNNRIREMEQLDSLKGVKLVELVLDGNPVCNKYKDESVYVSEVRKRFPKVLKLDGADLPPPIGFDVPDDRSVPSTKGSFVCSQEGQVVIRQFLEQYYMLFDTDNRQPLLDAYHVDAVFSMTCNYPPGHCSSSSSAKLNNYLPDSRNILRVKEPARRLKMLSQGKLNIVSALSQLPKTKHDLASFAVDLPLFNSQLMVLSVSGMFMESAEPKTPIRSFNRVFIIAPLGAGFCITNDMLFITNPSEEQFKMAFKHPVAVAPAPVVSPVTSPQVAAVPGPSVVDDSVKEQMILAVAQQTTMNLVWSRKCLEENQWNYEKAMEIFAVLHKNGQVPPEAFVQ